MIPHLGDHTGRFQQHAQYSQFSIELDREFRLDAEEFCTKPVARLDAMLGVFAIATHVPFPCRASHAWDGVGMPHKSDDQIAGSETAAGRRLLHPAERFMTEDQPLLPGRRGSVIA